MRACPGLRASRAVGFVGRARGSARSPGSPGGVGWGLWATLSATLGQSLGGWTDPLSPPSAGRMSGWGGPQQRRRVPGLRREELARLANVSADYYIRLELDKAPAVPDDVVHALARALRLSADEQEYLLNVARRMPVARDRDPVAADVARRLIDDMSSHPGMVLDGTTDCARSIVPPANSWRSIPSGSRGATWHASPSRRSRGSTCSPTSRSCATRSCPGFAGSRGCEPTVFGS